MGHHLEVSMNVNEDVSCQEEEVEMMGKGRELREGFLKVIGWNAGQSMNGLSPRNQT